MRRAPIRFKTASTAFYGRRPPRGFTLIEVLLTSVLAATLMAALWALLSMHLKMFDTGQAKTEQSQLARTLLDRIADDLRATVQLPPPVIPVPTLTPAVPATVSTATPAAASSANSKSAPSTSPKPNTPATPAPTSTAGKAAAPANPSASKNPASKSGGSTSASTSTAKNSTPATPGLSNQPTRGPISVTSSLRPPGLFGTENYLQIDVLDPVIVTEEIEDRDMPLGVLAPSRAAELRTIIYSFEEDQDTAHPLGEQRMHLVRREMDWEQAHAAPHNGSRGKPRAPLSNPSGPEASGEPLLNPLGSRGNADPRETIRPEATATVPEVLHMVFRYFDGAIWLPEWDSVARRGLPVAVEVAFRFRPLDEPEPTTHAAPGQHQPAEAPPLENLEIQNSRWPVFRMVIHLPAGGTRPANSPSAPGRPGPPGKRGPQRGTQLTQGGGQP